MVDVTTLNLSQSITSKLMKKQLTILSKIDHKLFKKIVDNFNVLVFDLISIIPITLSIAKKLESKKVKPTRSPKIVIITDSPEASQKLLTEMNTIISSDKINLLYLSKAVLKRNKKDFSATVDVVIGQATKINELIKSAPTKFDDVETLVLLAADKIMKQDSSMSVHSIISKLSKTQFVLTANKINEKELDGFVKKYVCDCMILGKVEIPELSDNDGEESTDDEEEEEGSIEKIGDKRKENVQKKKVSMEKENEDEDGDSSEDAGETSEDAGETSEEEDSESSVEIIVEKRSENVQKKKISTEEESEDEAEESEEEDGESEEEDGESEEEVIVEKRKENVQKKKNIMVEVDESSDEEEKNEEEGESSEEDEGSSEEQEESVDEEEGIVENKDKTVVHHEIIKKVKSVSKFGSYQKTAQRLIETEGAVQSLSKAIALIIKAVPTLAKVNGKEVVSKLSGRTGYTGYWLKTNIEIYSNGYLFKCLKKQMDEDVVEKIERLQQTKDKKGFVFDVPNELKSTFTTKWVDSKFDSLTMLGQELPDLLENEKGLGGHGAGSQVVAGRGGFERGRGGSRGGGFERGRGGSRGGGFERGRGGSRGGGFERGRGGSRGGGFERGRGGGRGGFERGRGGSDRGRESNGMKRPFNGPSPKDAKIQKLG